MSTAPSVVMLWKANSTPALLVSACGDALGGSLELVAVDDVDHRGGHDGADAEKARAEAAERPEAGVVARRAGGAERSPEGTTSERTGLFVAR